MATVRQWLATMYAHRDSDHAPPSPDSDNGPGLSAKQRAAVARGAGVVRRWGGVLLADAVGLGKTRVAVAMARRVVSDARRRRRRTTPALFVVPARLRDRWRDAITAAGWQVPRDADIISHHRLSRGDYDGRPPVIVVDEAHRFRNPSAKRSRHLAKLTAHCPPILVTATPVCTCGDDLHQLLGYFVTDPVAESRIGMGLQAAFDAHEAGEFDIVQLLEQVVIRRHRPDFGPGGRPSVRFELLRYRASDDEKWLWKNLESQLRKLNFAATADHWPRGLLINNLVRMFESGPDALEESLRELIHFHDRWLDAAATGATLERPDFLELFDGVDHRQQVFPFLYNCRDSIAPDETRRRQVVDDRRALKSLQQRLDRICGNIPAVHAAIADAIADEDSSKFLLFTAYQTSARALFDALAVRGFRVGLITGDGARATGLGSATDREVLRRFHPDDDRKRPAHRTLRILVATDCLAEGHNLQGCARLVLADLPYSPVKLEQRIGRIARPGASNRWVTVYLPRPHCWTDSLGLRRRITHRLKTADELGAAQTLVGTSLFDADNDGGGDDDDEHDDSDANDGDTKAASPLAAMTRQQRLRDGLNGVDTDDVPTRCTTAGAGDGNSDDNDVLWVRLQITGPADHHLWLSVESGQDSPTLRLSDQLSGLAQLADSRHPVEPWRPTGTLWRRAKRWIDRHRAMLRAARMAPPLLGENSAFTRAWRRLRRAVDRGELSVGKEKLTCWRRALLQPQPRGIGYELEELLDTDSDCEPQALARLADQLPAPPPRREVDIEVTGALLFTAELASRNRHRRARRGRRRPALPAGESASSCTPESPGE